MKPENFAQTLEIWYAAHGRDLPWRGTKDAYRIWVSEIILQQTRVEQGHDYFVRFVRRFPTVEALAAASEDEVLKHWQGLGYYSRARNLHSAARSIRTSGAFPHTYKEVRALKGVGDYTASAICSFAYGLPCAVVDGNVYRVLSRHFGLDAPIDSAAGKKLFAELADRLLDRRRPALYNQAIMDFGALQCTPHSPDCAVCPLSGSCAALQAGRVDELPVKEKVTKISNRYFCYFYIRCGGKTLLRKRTARDIWRGLYEPPMLELPAPPTEADVAALPALSPLLSQTDATLTLLKRGVKQQLSHQLIRADFYLLNLGEEADFSAAAWLSPYLQIPENEVERYAVPRLVADLLALLI